MLDIKKTDLDQIDLDIYKCNSCNKNFAVGVDFCLWNYLYKPKGISFNEAFEIYSKELKEKGATAIHLKEKPEVCPYCKQTSFDIAKIKPEDPTDSLVTHYRCTVCNSDIFEGIFEYFRLHMVAIGIESYKKIFEIYKKRTSLGLKKSAFLVGRLVSCPNCKASKKKIKLVPRTIFFRK